MNDEEAPLILFDASDFDRRLSAGEDPLPLFRDALRQGSAELAAQFVRQTAVARLVLARSDLIDELLRRAWRRTLPPGAGAALVAVGGYGRGELHPASDVDIMILLAGTDPSPLREPLEAFLTFLWDIGLEVGHSVRTVEDCVREATRDITVITNLVEARLLTGPRPLFAAMLEATAPDRIWPGPAFFEAKCEEQRARWHKYGDTAYNLEPNIKENPGGLRDIQMIGWVTKRHFGTDTLHQLVARGFLTADEYRALRQGRELLWKIRFALHRLSGRREDRLLFDYQRTLAEQFGYADQDHNLAVEQFMQRYYRTVMELNRLNEMLLQLYQEVILLHSHLDPPVPINKRFQARNGFLEVTDDGIFERYPVALIEVFLLMQTHPELKGVRATTIRQIRAHRHRIDRSFRQDLRARSLFMEIIRQPVGITHELRRMNRYGILAAYIPAFANIVGRMQYDLFHVYTVDAHTLFVVRNLRRFSVTEHAQEFPLCSAIETTIPKPELLIVAALFHDIAKGRGGDHSVLGARDAWEFCQLHGLSTFDSALVSWLVRKHLVMSMTAQRKDISDQDVVQSFAGEIGDTTRLDYLYLLTVADARATNPKRWNSWIDSLLKELYHATRHALLRGLDNPQAQDELVQQKQTEAGRLLQLWGLKPERYVPLWAGFNLDFFLHNAPDRIAWQSRVILEAGPDELPLTAIRPETARGCSEIFLYTADQDNLFAFSTALLDQLGLNILDARIITTDDGRALNSYLVLEQDGSTIGDEHRQQEILDTVRQRLVNPEQAESQVSRRLPRKHRHFPSRTHIGFADDRPNDRTVMRLATGDRPGLLADVGYAFAACGIRLQNAKIATIGANADDVFFITDRHNRPVDRPEQRECLRENLNSRLSGTQAP